MAGKYKLLLKMQLYGLFGINRLLHSHDKREKRRILFLSAAVLPVLGILSFLSGFISSVFADMGLAQVIPALITVIYSLTVLLLTFLKSSGVLTGLKDYDMVMSLPVNPTVIVLSRLTMLYLTNLLIGIISLLPAIVVYCRNISVSPAGYFFLSSAFLFAPMIPMLAALAIGILIVAAASKSKHHHIVALICSLAGVLSLVFASSELQTMDRAQIADLSTAILRYFHQFYPPASLVSKALMHHDWGSFGIFVFGSAAALLAFVTVVSHFYKRLNTQAFSHRTGNAFKLKQSASSPFMALYRRELSRLFSCTVYALNSCVAIVLLLAASILAAFYLPQASLRQLEAAGVMDRLEAVLPLGISVFVCVCCTTSASLSLEGKSRWILCSLPVKATTVFQAKILVNLTVVLPVLWISLILWRAAFPMPALQTVLLFVIPTLYALFISAAGMLLNVKYPRYDWKSEYYAVKGGAASVLAATGSGLMLSTVPTYLCVLFHEYAQSIAIGAAAIIAVVTVMCYRMLAKVRLYL